LIPFAAGISISPDSNLISISLFIFFWVCLLTFEFFGCTGKWTNRKKVGILIYLLLFTLGLNCSIGYPDNAAVFNKGSITMVHLQKLDKSNENQNRYVSIIYSKINDSLWRKSRCFLYIASSIQELKTGAIFVTLNPPKWIKPVFNPGSFDFSAYAKQRQIYHTLYINNQRDYIVLTYRKDRLLDFLDKTRRWIIHTIKAKISIPSEAGLTEALLIGFKEDLDYTLQEQYTATGVSHIIAVSGMHLGLIFYVLTMLISHVVSRKNARLVGLSIILPLLWTFALITGASPSVLRSVVVFTILLLGNAMLKKSGSINALLTSAFFLLVFQPNLITDIGFQLSYAAVLSIIIFEPMVSRWLYLKNKSLAYLWSMIAITIAAQILTTPIVLYHFKQFPVFFLITNLIAVPLSSLVLLLAIGLCLFSLIHLPTTLLAQIIHICLSGMNTYIGKIAAIPFNSIPISITLSTVIFSYVLILVIPITFRVGKSKSILPLLFTLLLLGLSHHSHRYQLLSKRQIFILHFSNETFIIHQHGKSGRLYCSERFSRDTTKFRRFLYQLNKQLDIQYYHLTGFKQQPALLRIKEPSSKKTIVIMYALDKLVHHLKQLGADSSNYSILIADGSNKLWKIRQWEKQAHELHLRLHSTQEMGALILPCKHE
jgi:competence protein ComEC